MENTILPIFALAFVSRPNECKKLFFTHHNVLSVWIKEGGGRLLSILLGNVMVLVLFTYTMFVIS